MTSVRGSQPLKPSRGGWRRSAFLVMVVLGSYLFVEVVSYAAIWWIDGQRFSVARFQRERESRLIEHLASRNENTSSEKTTVLHPYLGYVANPRNPGPFPYPVSDYGFNDDEPPVHKRSDERVIVGIFGGSLARHFAFRGGVEALEAKLGTAPQFRGKEFDFVTTGMGSYKQPQQLMALNYIQVLGGEFDIVINLDGFNEVAIHFPRNAKRDVASYFPSNWDLRVGGAAHPEHQRLLGEIEFLRDVGAALNGGFSTPPLPYSVTLNLLWRMSERLVSLKLADLQLAFADFEAPQKSYEATGPPSEYSRREEVIGALVDVWKRSSIQMDRLSRANHALYLHFLQPNQYVPGSKPVMDAAERRLAYNDRSPYREGVLQGYPRLIEEGRELRSRGVRFHDLTMIFSDVGEPLYSDSCCHLNERGYQLLADAIARAILSGIQEPGR